MVELKKIKEFVWQIEGTKVPAYVFASDKILEAMKNDKTLEQAKNMTALPGALKILALPDSHQGYGFCIGGVAALDYEKGGVSPGGIGYDVNCGVRLLTTPLTRADVKDKMNQLVEECYKAIPAGLGEGNIKISREELDKVLEKGALWAFEKGYGLEDDLANSEESGTFKGADASKVSDKAKNRGKNQLGSLGSGNHFLEVQYVSDVIDNEKAKVFGLKKNQVVFMIHCGSRGLGHQVCSDYLRRIEQEFPSEIAKLPDRELVYAPAGTQACEDYLKAMKAAANFAWCYRYIIADLVRK